MYVCMYVCMYDAITGVKITVSHQPISSQISNVAAQAIPCFSDIFQIKQFDT